jgi:hypothetical protein
MFQSFGGPEEDCIALFAASRKVTARLVWENLSLLLWEETRRTVRR